MCAMSIHIHLLMHVYNMSHGSCLGRQQFRRFFSRLTTASNRAYSKEFFGVHNFSGSSSSPPFPSLACPPLPLGVGALGVGPLESS